MTLEVIGAGFGRTGTMSTREALNKLGYPCYHMTEVVLNPANRRHLRFWQQVAHSPEGAQHDWETVFGTYRAALDFPAVTVWKELLAAYPDAKVLLTLHPHGGPGWYDSAISTIWYTESMWQWKVIETLFPFGRRFGPMQRELIWNRSLRGTMPDRDRAIARYDAHVAEVIETVPPERLLVFRVTDGWEPLCRFLDEPMPNEPFPCINDRREFCWVNRAVAAGAYALLAACGLLAAGAVWGLTLLL
ncbi:sulfotransferase family protein [Psychromarinibacter sp. C21-152]|uniref:Sulfotransferase family protein n=1 Tax=Psychromarinibacter sediminicola TaxID=3033385 RepID=A0AAE3NWJ6_9RHOB|nr:sulfotransferase family protein [Psychromarinibacter sediminicola]MDF0603447.1 sulfotransferase family protein [Psychromarinibacter sediminicola]